MLQRQIQALVEQQARLRKILTDALLLLVLGFWSNFNRWDDPDWTLANAARTAYAVENANLKLRQSTRSYLANYLMVAGENKSALAPVTEIQDYYPRDDIDALSVYQRIADEYHFNRRKLLNQRDDALEKIDSVKAELDKVIDSSANARNLSDLVKEAKELDRLAETPSQRRDRRSSERKSAYAQFLEDFNAKIKAREADTEDDEEYERILALEFQGELDKLGDDIYDDAMLETDAKYAALDRLQKLAEMDQQLARRDEAADYLEPLDEVIGYRRIIHPELSESGVCGMCVVAATRMYKKSDLEPIHFYCKCEVLPATKRNDPGLQLNADSLQKFYDDAKVEGDENSKGMTIDELSNTRYKEVPHGEMGRVLEFATQVKKNDPALDLSKRKARNAKDPVFRERRDMEELQTLYSSQQRLKLRYYRDGETDLLPTFKWTNARISQLENRMTLYQKIMSEEGKVTPRKRSGESNSRRRASTKTAATTPSLTGEALVRQRLAQFEKQLDFMLKAQEEDLNITKLVGKAHFDPIERYINRDSAIAFNRKRIAELKKELGIK